MIYLLIIFGTLIAPDCYSFRSEDGTQASTISSESPVIWLTEVKPKKKQFTKNKTYIDRFLQLPILLKEKEELKKDEVLFR